MFYYCRYISSLEVQCAIRCTTEPPLLLVLTWLSHPPLDCWEGFKHCLEIQVQWINISRNHTSHSKRSATAHTSSSFFSSHLSLTCCLLMEPPLSLSRVAARFTTIRNTRSSVKLPWTIGSLIPEFSTETARLLIDTTPGPKHHDMGGGTLGHCQYENCYFKI